MSSCTLVLGTPRSGTSCVAGVLHRLGVRMTLTEFVPANAGNPTGYHEDPGVIEALGCVPAGVPSLADRHLIRERLGAVIAARCAAGVPWGAKTHRLAFCWREWVRLCPVPVRVVRTVREPHRSRASIVAAFGGGANVVDEVHTALASLESAPVPVLAVSLDALVSDPAAEVARLAAFVGLPVNDAAVAFVDPSLRRH